MNKSITINIHTEICVFFMAVLALACEQASSNWGEQRLLSVAVCGLLLAVASVGSVVSRFVFFRSYDSRA